MLKTTSSIYKLWETVLSLEHSEEPSEYSGFSLSRDVLSNSPFSEPDEGCAHDTPGISLGILLSTCVVYFFFLRLSLLNCIKYYFNLLPWQPKLFSTGLNKTLC